MARQKKQRVDTTGAGFGGSMADLLRQSGVDVSAAAPADPVPEPQAPQALSIADCEKVVLRKERKGRKGKTVTLVEGLDDLTDDTLKALAKTLRKAMGCGVGVEGRALVLQGDQRVPARAHLERLGARKVVG